MAVNGGVAVSPTASLAVNRAPLLHVCCAFSWKASGRHLPCCLAQRREAVVWSQATTRDRHPRTPESLFPASTSLMPALRSLSHPSPRSTWSALFVSSVCVCLCTGRQPAQDQSTRLYRRQVVINAGLGCRQSGLFEGS